MKLRKILVLSLITSGIAEASSSNPPEQPSKQVPNLSAERMSPSMSKSPKTKEGPKTGTSIEGEYLISFEPQVSKEERTLLFEKVGVKELEKVGSSPLYLILIAGKDSEAKIESLKGSKGVRYVEANFSFKILDKSEDK